MRNKYLLLFAIVVLFASCSVTEPIKKSVAYKGVYDERPLAILIMPPINRSTNVEAKEFFHSTLNVTLANMGYYVVPPFLSMEMIKKESAYDAELFIESPLDKFGEYFGADAVLFTIIHAWNKNAIGANVNVQVEYILKSTKTNEVLFNRTGDISYNASVSGGGGGLLGALIDITASAINTAATSYISVGRACNSYTLHDMPTGKYNPGYGLDGEQTAGDKIFRATVK